MKKIIITGANGYIGNCLFYFLKKKFKVVGIDKKKLLIKKLFNVIFLIKKNLIQY